jgi:hypothetical protein
LQSAFHSKRRYLKNKKTPLTFTKENAKEVIFYLHKIFGEDFMKII